MPTLHHRLRRTLTSVIATSAVVLTSLTGAAITAAPASAVDCITGATAIQTAIDGATAGDTIVICAGTHVLSQTLVVDKDLTFTGPATGTAVLDGNSAVRIMLLQATDDALIDVTIDSLVFQNGAIGMADPSDASCPEQCGGAIFTQDGASLTITDTTFLRNRARFAGGAIGRSGIDGNSSAGTLTVTGSTFDSNYGGVDAGGIFSIGGADVSLITNSTFVNNRASQRSGGAIGTAFQYGTMTINASTFLNNSSGDNYSTIVGGSEMTITNSIIASSTAGGLCNDGPVASGNITSIVTADAAECVGATQVAYSALKLGFLANWGGPTKTINIASDSPAIDSGNAETCPTVDQRGVTRATCDLGAFEYVAGGPTLSPLSQTAATDGVGVPITPTTAFTASGFTGPVTYAIAPAVSNGFAFSTATGVLSGAPLAASGPVTYTITGTDSSDTVSYAQIVVAAVTPPGQISDYGTDVTENGLFQASAIDPTDGSGIVISYYGGGDADSYQAFLIDAQGERVAGPINFLNDGTDIDSYAQPGIAYNPFSGGWVTCFGEKTNADAVCQFLNADGTSASADIRLNDLNRQQSWQQASIAYQPETERFYVLAGDYNNVWARWIDADPEGAGALGDVITINAGSDVAVNGGTQLAYSPTSDTFMAIARGRASSSEQYGPWAFSLDSDGVPVGSPSRFGTTDLDLSNGSIAYNSDRDEFVIVAFSYDTDAGKPLYLQRYKASDGTPVGSLVQKALPDTFYVGGSGGRYRPSLAIGDADDMVITAALRLASADTEQLIYSLRATGDGVISDPEFLAGFTGVVTGNRPRIAYNPITCDFLTTYNQQVGSWQLYASMIEGSGACGSTAPSAPRSVTATAAAASANVAWLAPTSDGGSAITQYVVTATPGSRTCTATAPALLCTVSGLANGTAYTFTVQARNSVGLSSASAASNSVTPSATPAPVPVPVPVPTPTATPTRPSSVPTATPGTSQPTQAPQQLFGAIAPGVAVLPATPENVRVVLRQPGTKLSQAPVVEAVANKPVALAVGFLTPGTSYNIKVKINGKYVSMGSVKADANGRVQLPAIEVGQAEQLTFALVDSKSGKPNYVKVKIVKPVKKTNSQSVSSRR